MLVAAGLEHKTAAEIADAYEAAFHADAALLNLLPAHVFPRATEHIPEMLELAERARRRGPRLRQRQRQRLLRGRVVPRLRRAVRQHPRRRCGPATAARSSATSATPPTSRSGRRPARAAMLKWPTPRWGEGFPGWHLECSAMALAPSRAAVRRPHRRDRQRLPPPRGRDRPVGADRRRAAGAGLGPRRVPPGRRPEDGEVGRQHRADRGRRGARHRPARVPLPVPDLALPPQARVHRRRRWPRRPPGSRRCGPVCAALGPAPADGPWAAPAAAPGGRARRTGPIGHGRRASRATATGRGPELTRPGPRARPLPSPPAGRALHDRFVAAIDDDLDLPTALAVVRETLRAPIAADERRWLVLDADFVLGPGPRPDLVDAARDRRRNGPRRGPARCSTERTAARTARDFARADELRARIAAEGWEIVDGPDGSVVRRAT